MEERTEENLDAGRGPLLLETRTAIDIARMVAPLLRVQFRRRPRRDRTHVIVIPGFGAGDASTLPLRHYLDRLGFCVEGWGLGRNRAGVNLPHVLSDLSGGWDISSPPRRYRGEGSVPYLCDRVADRVRDRYAAVGRPVSLIGWSLGGYLAREVARDLPGIVVRVITLASPIVGGPKYTSAARFFRRRGMDLDWIETKVAARESRPIRQPITAIYSKSDGIVNWPAAIDRHSDNVRHIEIDAAHLGMGFNPTVWRHVVEALDAS